MKIKKINQRSKKGFLLGEHTINIIIAVMCILILAYIGYNFLYKNITQKTDLQKAEAHMEQINGIIDALTIQDGGEAEYYLYNPDGWSLVYYSSWEDFRIEKHTFTSSIYRELYTGAECSSNCLCFCPHNKSRSGSGAGHRVMSNEYFYCNNGVCFNREENFVGHILEGISSGENIGINILKNNEGKFEVKINAK